MRRVSTVVTVLMEIGMFFTLRTSLLSLLAATCFLGRAGYAQHMNAADSPCQNAGSNADETSCFIDSSKKMDIELNHVYGVVLTIVNGEESRELKSTQRLWIQFRNSNCSAEQRLYLGGSAAQTVYYACLEAMTRHRIAELKTMYGWRVEKQDKTF